MQPGTMLSPTIRFTIQIYFAERHDPPSSHPLVASGVVYASEASRALGQTIFVCRDLPTNKNLSLWPLSFCGENPILDEHVHSQEFYPATGQVAFIITEFREHAPRGFHVGLPAHFFPTEPGCHEIVHNGGCDAHGEKVWLMAGVTPGAVFAGPEGIDDAELLAWIKHHARSFVHRTQDFLCLIDGEKVLKTTALVPRAWREGAEVILHGHGEPAKGSAVSLAHGHVDQDIHGAVYEVLETLGALVLSPGLGYGRARPAPAPSALDPCSFWKHLKWRVFNHVGAVAGVVDMDVGGFHATVITQGTAYLCHDGTPGVLLRDVVCFNSHHRVRPGFARGLDEYGSPGMLRIPRFRKGTCQAVHVLPNRFGIHKLFLARPGGACFNILRHGRIA